MPALKMSVAQEECFGKVLSRGLTHGVVNFLY